MDWIDGWMDRWIDGWTGWMAGWSKPGTYCVAQAGLALLILLPPAPPTAEITGIYHNSLLKCFVLLCFNSTRV
jgi:hypothetical protein